MPTLSFDLQNEVVAGASFVCSLSNKMRLCLQVDPSVKEKITKIAHGVIQTITSVAGVAESLRNESIPGVVKAMRQIDLRNEAREMIFKSFTFWNYDLNCWHVLLEGCEETFWEEQQDVIGKG